MTATSIDLFLVVFILAQLELLVEALSRWRPGEEVKSIDNSDRPQDLQDSEHGVVRFYRPAGTSDVSITYQLQRVAPNRTYLVSFHIFHRGPLANPGGEPAIPLKLPQTQEFVNLTTDASGNADFTLNVSGLGPGEYDFAFDAREAQP